MAHRNLVVLTGAGVSAESGVPTFRGADGLWEGHRFEDVATPEAFARDPVLVQRFYNLRRAALANVRPNAAHHALAELAARWEGDFLLVTQNVDDLHDRAEAEAPPAPGFELIHMHGELLKGRCTRSGVVSDWTGDMAPDEPSPDHPEGRMRPHIVWFGEMPLSMNRIEAALARCDLFVSIGTAGAVYPAAGFVQLAQMAGARTVEINLEPSLGASAFDEGIYGPATETVPAFFGSL
jgi:NAD-dependent deacetylase